ncbi:MAG: hypothetical protein N3G80_01150 [Candidatus Micrarchaeota archaeon]|nr:hypothetical protein [Candidatus Micrarchaeota archaeon]
MPAMKESSSPLHQPQPQESVRAFIRQNPLASRHLSLSKWSETPWKINHIVSEAILALERESTNETKRQLAFSAINNMKERIKLAKQLYSKLVQEEGQENELAAKLKHDISFMENMYNIIEAQVNGLVSRQNSWKARVKDIEQRYTKQALVLTPWENIRKKNPWITLAMGAGVGAAMWFTNGWNAAVQLTQYLLHLGHQSKFILERIPSIVNFFVAASAIGAAAFVFSKAAKSKFVYGFFANMRQESFEKKASLVGAISGAISGAVLFFTGQLNGIVEFFVQAWRTIHLDQQIKQFINPLAEFVWNVGGMILFGWGVNKLDRDSLLRKEKLADECEQKQQAIVEEEKIFRRKVIAIIKQKAIYLSALYGYTDELDLVDPQISELAKKKDFAKINEIHKSRMQEIFGAEQKSDFLLEAASLDSNSTDVVGSAGAVLGDGGRQAST